MLELLSICQQSTPIIAMELMKNDSISSHFSSILWPEKILGNNLLFCPPSQPWAKKDPTESGKVEIIIITSQIITFITNSSGGFRACRFNKLTLILNPLSPKATIPVTHKTEIIGNKNKIHNIWKCLIAKVNANMKAMWKCVLRRGSSFNFIPEVLLENYIWCKGQTQTYRNSLIGHLQMPQTNKVSNWAPQIFDHFIYWSCESLNYHTCKTFSLSDVQGNHIVIHKLKYWGL